MYFYHVSITDAQDIPRAPSHVSPHNILCLLSLPLHLPNSSFRPVGYEQIKWWYTLKSTMPCVAIQKFYIVKPRDTDNLFLDTVDEVLRNKTLMMA